MTIEEIKGHKLEIPPAETGLSSLRQRLRRGVSGYPKSSKHHFSNKIICRGILQQHDLASLLLHVYYGRILCSVELTSMPRLRHASTSLQPTARPQISMPPLRLQRASRDPDLHTSTSVRLQRASSGPYLRSATSARLESSRASCPYVATPTARLQTSRPPYLYTYHISGGHNQG